MSGETIGTVAQVMYLISPFFRDNIPAGLYVLSQRANAHTVTNGVYNPQRKCPFKTTLPMVAISGDGSSDVAHYLNSMK